MIFVLVVVLQDVLLVETFEAGSLEHLGGDHFEWAEAEHSENNSDDKCNNQDANNNSNRNVASIGDITKEISAGNCDDDVNLISRHR